MRTFSATASPAGPLPTTAIRPPLSCRGLGTGKPPRCVRSQSVTNASSLPIATGLAFFPTTQWPSQRLSCGHSRPHSSGISLVERKIAAASPIRPSSRKASAPGMSLPTGQAFTQGSAGHWMQRCASNMAGSGV